MRYKLVAGVVSLAVVGAVGSASANSSPSFSNADVNGTYTEKFSGFTVGSGTQPTTGSPVPYGNGTAFPETGTGIMTADGNGNFTATVVINVGGVSCAGTLAGGSGVSGGDGIPTGYSVNLDGFGTARGIFTPLATPSLPPQVVYACPPAGGHQDETFTIVNPGEIDFVSIDSDTTISGTAKQQH